MSAIRILSAAATPCLLVSLLVLGGCEEQGSAEKLGKEAGQKIDQAIEQTKEGLDKAKENAARLLEEGEQKAEEAAEQAEEDTRGVAEEAERKADEAVKEAPKQ